MQFETLPSDLYDHRKPGCIETEANSAKIAWNPRTDTADTDDRHKVLCVPTEDILCYASYLRHEFGAYELIGEHVTCPLVSSDSTNGFFSYENIESVEECYDLCLIATDTIPECHAFAYLPALSHCDVWMHADDCNNDYYPSIVVASYHPSVLYMLPSDSTIVSAKIPGDAMYTAFSRSDSDCTSINGEDTDDCNRMHDGVGLTNWAVCEFVIITNPPTVPVTQDPTGVPSSNPTPLPSNNPTTAGDGEPSALPTAIPSSHPTLEPECISEDIDSPDDITFWDDITLVGVVRSVAECETRARAAHHSAVTGLTYATIKYPDRTGVFAPECGPDFNTVSIDSQSDCDRIARMSGLHSVGELTVELKAIRKYGCVQTRLNDADVGWNPFSNGTTTELSLKNMLCLPTGPTLCYATFLQQRIGDYALSEEDVDCVETGHRGGVRNNDSYGSLIRDDNTGGNERR